MKRNVTITSRAKDATITVQIKVDSHQGCLTREEVQTVIERLADSVAESVSRAYYCQVPLCRVKVKL